MDELIPSVAGASWPRYLAAGLLVMVRLSGLVAFAPMLSSAVIPPRVKAALVISMSFVLAPVAALLPGALGSVTAASVLGELGVGLLFGLSLMMLNEALMFTGTLLGMQFSFSLVNLLDPNSMVETPVLGQMLGLLSTLVLIGAGLDRTMLMALMRSFQAVPVGTAIVSARAGAGLAVMAGGIFAAGLQLAAPVIAAALAIEVTIALVSRLAPQLPAMVLSVPLKTMVSYGVLIASLGVWPGWIERHFTALLDAACRLMVLR